MKNLTLPNEANLKNKMAELDEEFKDFLSGLRFRRDFVDNELKTFSPLDMVAGFEQRGLQRVHEVTKPEMQSNEDGMRKLLANMLHQCRPGSLSDEDVEQLSGINGREAVGEI